MVDYIENESFYCKTNIVYPPFKNGLYMEEYFLEYVTKHNIKYDKNGRLYIPCLWTNFQTESWFQERKTYKKGIAFEGYVPQKSNTSSTPLLATERASRLKIVAADS
jgi:hypothetical protein